MARRLSRATVLGNSYQQPWEDLREPGKLERLAQSFNLLRPSIFLNVKRAPIAFTTPEAAVSTVKVPRLLDITFRRRLDAQGKPLMATAALDYFSNQIEYAHNLVYKFWDEEGNLQWDYSGRQANYRQFDLDSAAYLNRTMLLVYFLSLDEAYDEVARERMLYYGQLLKESGAPGFSTALMAGIRRRRWSD